MRIIAFVRGWKAPLLVGALLWSCIVADYAHVRWNDPRDLFSVQTPSGPFEVVHDADGTPMRGESRTTFRAGETVGWISNICLRDGVSMWGTLTMVSADNGRQVNFREQPVASRRCGPVLSRMAIPVGTPPGDYRINRWVAARRGTDRELSESLASIAFSVEP